MHKRKNIRLSIILLVLVSAVLLLEFNQGEADHLGVDKKLFQLDANREINQVVLEGPKETNQFDFRNGRWFLNDTLYLDQSMRDVFFSIVSQLQIRRPVLRTKADSVEQLLINEGVKTTISFGDEQIQQYWIGGNRQQQVSWIMGEDRVPYQVHIPGYQSYVAGIFRVPAADWRSRFLLDINFALVKTIEIAYPEARPGLTLNFENNFFTIPGVQADSLKIANFLESLSFLQAESFIAQPSVDELENEQPVATLSIRLVNGDQVEIPFFEDPQDEQFFLARLADQSLAKTDRQAVTRLFKIPADFE